MSGSDVMFMLIIVLLVINLVGLLIIGLIVGAQSRETQQLKARMTELEAKVRYMPTHQDLTSLRTDMNKMAEATATLAGKTGTMAEMLETIQRHLLEKD